MATLDSDVPIFPAGQPPTGAGLCIECQANQASATSEERTVAWGQIELYSHVPVLRNFVEHLKHNKLNVYAVYLLDSQ